MTTDTVLTIFYAMMIGIAMFALLQSQRLATATKYALTCLLALLAIDFLGKLFISSGAYKFAPSLAGFELPLRLLLGPAVYFYTRSTLTLRPMLSTRDIMIASIGPVAVLVVMLPFLGLNAEQKLALANPETRDPELFSMAMAICLAAGLIYIAVTGSYLAGAYMLQRRHRKKLLNRFSNIEKRSLDWLSWALTLWAIAWFIYALDFILMFFGLSEAGMKMLLVTFEFIALVGLSHMAINQPQLSVSDIKSEETAITRSPILDQQRMAMVVKALKSAMEDSEAYTQNDLSLANLSRMTKVSEHHLSETFTQSLDTNFYAFVNQYRVNAAKNLLLSSKLSITDIAVEVGFGSRSTFNAVFKKATGMTPSAFRKGS